MGTCSGGVPFCFVHHRPARKQHKFEFPWGNPLPGEWLPLPLAQVDIVLPSASAGPAAINGNHSAKTTKREWGMRFSRSCSAWEDRKISYYTLDYLVSSWPLFFSIFCHASFLLSRPHKITERQANHPFLKPKMKSPVMGKFVSLLTSNIREAWTGTSNIQMETLHVRIWTSSTVSHPCCQ